MEAGTPCPQIERFRHTRGLPFGRLLLALRHPGASRHPSPDPLRKSREGAPEPTRRFAPTLANCVGEEGDARRAVGGGFVVSTPVEESGQEVKRVVHLVDPRITFAAERTLLAWIRTALALMGVGALIREIVPGRREGEINGLAIALIVIGIASLIVAIRQHYKVVERLRRGETAFEAEISPGVLIALFLVFVGMAATIYIVTAR